MKSLNPKIKIINPFQIKKGNIKGTCIVIDVFRMSTTITCILKKKPKNLFLFNKNLVNQNLIKFSEVDRSAKYDNSPYKALISDIENKNVSIQSDNGTKVLKKVKNFEEVLICSFSNITSIIKYLKKRECNNIIIIPAGRLKTKKETIEDNLCANFLKNKLINVKTNNKNLLNKLNKAIKKRLIGDFNYHLFIDLQLCTKFDWINIVPKVNYDKDKNISIFDAKNSK